MADTFCIAQKVSKNASSKKGDCIASFILKSKCFFYRRGLVVLKFESNCDRRTLDFSFTITCFLNGMHSKKKECCECWASTQQLFPYSFLHESGYEKQQMPRELLFIVVVKCSPDRRQDCDEQNPSKCITYAYLVIQQYIVSNYTSHEGGF